MTAPTQIWWYVGGKVQDFPDRQWIEGGYPLQYSAFSRTYRKSNRCGAGIRDIEGNKVDKTAPMTDNMKNILAMVDAWSQAGRRILEIANSGQVPSREEVEQYTKLEQDAVNGVDAIIVTAADNALKFKNTAMENASASTMTLCFIFAAAFGITLLMLGILRKRILSPSMCF